MFVPFCAHFLQLAHDYLAQQMFMENWFHLFLGTGMEMHIVICVQHWCCTTILYMAAVSQLCVSHPSTGKMPATL